MQNSAAPYNDKLPAGCEYKYMKCNALGHASNQLTINPKDGKCLLCDPDLSPSSPSSLPSDDTLPVSPLGKLPKKASTLSQG